MYRIDRSLVLQCGVSTSSGNNASTDHAKDLLNIAGVLLGIRTSGQ